MAVLEKKKDTKTILDEMIFIFIRELNESALLIRAQHRLPSFRLKDKAEHAVSNVFVTSSLNNRDKKILKIS